MDSSPNLSCSNTISHDEIAIGLKNHKKHTKNIGNINTHQQQILLQVIVTVIHMMMILTETEDFFSSNEEFEPETETDSKPIPINTQSISINYLMQIMTKIK